jgi:sugar O-acyltransferase (sialic acid O-acetyltransferase NeuD family)
MKINKQTVIIAGSSGHLKVIIDIFEKENKYKILGLLDPHKNIGEKVSGYKVIGRDEDLPDLLSGNVGCKIFVAIGDNWLRQRIVNKLIAISPNIDFASTIHPSAQIGKDVRIGKGVAIMAGSIINSDTIIEDFTIINTKASIDHECKMLQFSSLAPNATTGGNVIIGEYSAISIGAIIKHGISIGKHTVIGAGALVMKNCGDNQIMYGVPAKEIRKREIGEKYL